MAADSSFMTLENASMRETRQTRRSLGFDFSFGLSPLLRGVLQGFLIRDGTFPEIVKKGTGPKAHEFVRTVPFC
jgi:hypothetical protein